MASNSVSGTRAPSHSDLDPSHSQLAALMAPFVGRTGGLISALRAVQTAYGYLPPDTGAAAAEAFNLTRAEVRGVISFYADFRDAPPAQTVMRVCVAEACQAVGARALRETLDSAYGGEADAAVEPVYCLGLCSCAPSVLVDDELVGRATADKIAGALARARGARA